MKMNDVQLLNWITVLLVVLKLFDFITISWWLVLLPTFAWLGIVVLVLVLMIALLTVGGIDANEFANRLAKTKENRRK